MMTAYTRKIVILECLLEILADLRAPTPAGPPTPTVVQCHGCFDIVHPGHIRYLEFARSQGDLLIVSITGDAGIDKGDQRPYIPQELRAENLAALEFVDYVIVDTQPTACDLLGRIRPDLYVKGQEYATSTDPRFIAEREVVESYGGRVIFSSGQVVFSSSRLIETIEQEDDLALRRMEAVCRRHGIDADRLVGLLDDLGGRRLLVIGDVVLERYVMCDATHVAGESPMMSLRELSTQDYLGGAAFVAAQLAALGAETVLVSAIGKDRDSAWAMEELTRRGVRVLALRHRQELAVKTRFVSDDTKLLRVERTQTCLLDSVAERQVADLLAAQALQPGERGRRADAAIVCDSGCGMISPGLLHWLSTDFRRRIPRLIGGIGGPQGRLAALRCFDLLCCSERTLRETANDFASGLSVVAYETLQKTQARQIFVSLGKGGLVTFDRPSHDPGSVGWTDRLRSEHLPALAGRAVDRLGGGEALLTMAGATAACGAGLMQSAYLASALAAVQVMRPGLPPVEPRSLLRWLEQRPELKPEEEPPRRVATAAMTPVSNR